MCVCRRRSLELYTMVSLRIAFHAQDVWIWQVKLLQRQLGHGHGSTWKTFEITEVLRKTIYTYRERERRQRLRKSHMNKKSSVLMENVRMGLMTWPLRSNNNNTGCLLSSVVFCIAQSLPSHDSPPERLYFSYTITLVLFQEDLLIHGDSVYDIIDKADHGTVQAELLRNSSPQNPPGEESRLFLCRMNVSRNARRQMRFGDQKVRSHSETTTTERINDKSDISEYTQVHVTSRSSHILCFFCHPHLKIRNGALNS